MIELIECIAASFYSLLAGFAKIYHINPFMLTSNFGTETLYILESFHQKKNEFAAFSKFYPHEKSQFSNGIMLSLERVMELSIAYY